MKFKVGLYVKWNRRNLPEWGLTHNRVYKIDRATDDPKIIRVVNDKGRSTAVHTDHLVLVSNNYISYSPKNKPRTV